MMPPKLIMAPVDFSDSHKALDVAADLASRLGAELLVAHIVPAIPDLPEGVSIFEERHYDKELHEAASKRLSGLATTLPDRISRCVRKSGDVAMELDGWRSMTAL